MNPLSLITGGIPWKWIGIGLAALAIVGTIWAGKSYVQKIQNDLAQTKVMLEREQTLRGLAETTRDETLRKHNDTINRMQTLENQRSSLETEVNELQDQIRNMTTEKDITHDPDRAVTDFNRQSDALNRMLEQLSRGSSKLRPPAGR